MPPKAGGGSGQADGSPPQPKTTPTKVTPTKEKNEKLIPTLSSTETRLLAFSTYWADASKVDYDELASLAGIMPSSARTLFRAAKRKMTKLVDEGASDDHPTPAKTPSKAGRKPKAAKKAAPAPVPTTTDEDTEMELDEEFKPLAGEPDEEAANTLLEASIKTERQDTPALPEA
ncbi:hypothetical protein MYU51_011581 [Penicillium brevicompactum]